MHMNNYIVKSADPPAVSGMSNSFNIWFTHGSSCINVSQVPIEMSTRKSGYEPYACP